MAVDEALLEAHRSHEDPAAGYREEFLQPSLGLGRTVAVLSEPLSPSGSVGWIVCHSFGMEQLHLGRSDVGVARRLSSHGFPVLRFHGQGYGDSEREMRVAGLASHIAEVTDAVDLMRERPGIERIGVIGARFGGLVASLVADREDLPFMALVEPIVRGGQFMRDFLRTQVFADMVAASENGDSSGVQKLRDQLDVTGSADIKGFPLTRQAYQEISAVDLAVDLTRFAGSSFLLGISRSGKPSSGLRGLSEHLERLGGTCVMDVIQEQQAAQFGQHHHRNDAGARKTDTAFELYRTVGSRVADWVGSLDGSSAEAPEVAS